MQVYPYRPFPPAPAIDFGFVGALAAQRGPLGSPKPKPTKPG